MFLQKKNGNSIDTYYLAEKKSALKVYREMILKTKPSSDLFYYLETNKEEIVKYLFNRNLLNLSVLQHDMHEIYDNDWSDLEKDIKSFTYTWHSKEVTHRQIMLNYIEGDYADLTPKIVFKHISPDCPPLYVHGFILPNDEYTSNNNLGNKFRVDNMLDLPLELTTLQLLEKSDFETLNKCNFNISEQIKLFEPAVLHSTIDISELQDLYDSKVITTSVEQITKRIDSTEKVLQKIK